MDKETGKVLASSDALMDAEQARVDEKNAAQPAALPGVLISKSEADNRLRAFIERVERMNAEVAELQQDIKEIYGEAKVNGYDVKTMRTIVRLRKMDVEKRREAEALLDVYKAAVGLD